MIQKLTPWEKRNLNVDSSIEFYIEHSDRWKDITGKIEEHKESYQVMHVPGGNTDVLMNAHLVGFLPIEMNIQLSRKLESLELPHIYKRFEPVISCNVATDNEKRLVLKAIHEGEIFSTDKIAKDPCFGPQYAAQRYAYWTQDIIEQGADLLCMKYKGKLAAFDICVNKGNGTSQAFLGGTLPEFRNKGLGFLTVYFITKYAMEKGFERIITGVSSNNISILKIHELFDYYVDSVSYCLIKHM